MLTPAALEGRLARRLSPRRARHARVAVTISAATHLGRSFLTCLPLQLHHPKRRKNAFAARAAGEGELLPRAGPSVPSRRLRLPCAGAALEAAARRVCTLDLAPFPVCNQPRSRSLRRRRRSSRSRAAAHAHLRLPEGHAGCRHLRGGHRRRGTCAHLRPPAGAAIWVPACSVELLSLPRTGETAPANRADASSGAQVETTREARARETRAPATAPEGRARAARTRRGRERGWGSEWGWWGRRGN